MFRYILINEDGSVEGTNCLELATKCATCEQFVVLDCDTRMLLGDALPVSQTKVKLEHFQ